MYYILNKNKQSEELKNFNGHFVFIFFKFNDLHYEDKCIYSFS